MEKPVLLWVDLTEAGRAPTLPADAEEECITHYIRNPEEIDTRILDVGPNVVCFEYDYPDRDGRAVLTRTKRLYPRLPIIMTTVYHSEALAVWALRSRVWDYIVKPFCAQDILRSVGALFKVSRQQERRAPREMISPLQDFAHLRAPSGHEKAILKAQTYIEKHLDEKIRLKTVAEHCGMSPAHFSRVFTQKCGIHFSELVLRTRIRRAVELLRNPNTTVTNVCYEVGFQDLSYCGRTFRRYVGMSPSQYRQAVLSGAHDVTQLYPELDLGRVELSQ